MQYIDTHCHIHSPEFFTQAEAEEALERAVESGVTGLLCVATSALLRTASPMAGKESL